VPTYPSPLRRASLVTAGFEARRKVQALPVVGKAEQMRGRSERVSESELSMRLRQCEHRWTTNNGDRVTGYIFLPRCSEWPQIPSHLRRKAPRPRSIESAQPGPRLNIGERRNPVVVRDQSDRSPVSRPQGTPNSTTGTGSLKKRTPTAERQRKYITGRIGPPLMEEITKAKAC
jgi:hypothetical protein